MGTCHCFLNNGTQLFTKPSIASVISHLGMILDIREAVCGFYQILCYFIEGILQSVDPGICGRVGGTTLQPILGDRMALPSPNSHFDAEIKLTVA